MKTPDQKTDNVLFSILMGIFAIWAIAFLLIATSHPAKAMKTQNYSGYELTNALDYAIDYLQLPDTITVIIQKTNGKSVGFDAITKQVTPQVYTIMINQSMSEKEAEETLFHELAHVSQFVTGTLKILDDMHYLWKGKKHEINARFHYDDPPERDARNVGKTMCFNYRKKNRK